MCVRVRSRAWESVCSKCRKCSRYIYLIYQRLNLLQPAVSICATVDSPLARAGGAGRRTRPVRPARPVRMARGSACEQALIRPDFRDGATSQRSCGAGCTIRSGTDRGSGAAAWRTNGESNPRRRWCIMSSQNNGSPRTVAESLLTSGWSLPDVGVKASDRAQAGARATNAGDRARSPRQRGKRAPGRLPASDATPARRAPRGRLHGASVDTRLYAQRPACGCVLKIFGAAVEGSGSVARSRRARAMAGPPPRLDRPATRPRPRWGGNAGAEAGGPQEAPGRPWAGRRGGRSMRSAPGPTAPPGPSWRATRVGPPTRRRLAAVRRLQGALGRPTGGTTRPGRSAPGAHNAARTALAGDRVPPRRGLAAGGRRGAPGRPETPSNSGSSG